MILSETINRVIRMCLFLKRFFVTFMSCRKGVYNLMLLDVEDNFLFSFLQVSSNHFSLVPVGVTVLLTHAFGIALLSSPQMLGSQGLEYGLSTDTSIYVGYLVMTLSMLILPLFACR